MKLIQLGGHKGSGEIRGWTTVDDGDYEWLSRWKWSLIDGYARRGSRTAEGKPHLVSMHRVLLDLEPGDSRQTDHINRDRLDNRRSNLRIVTQRENKHNMPVRKGSSRYRGVRRSRDAWQAYVMVDGKFHHLGVFSSEDYAGGVAFMARRLMLDGATD